VGQSDEAACIPAARIAKSLFRYFARPREGEDPGWIPAYVGMAEVASARSDHPQTHKISFSRRAHVPELCLRPRRKIVSPPGTKEGAERRKAHANHCRHADRVRNAPLVRVRGGSAHFRGALAFRRSAAALARANASAVGSAPVPAFPETRPDGRYPLRSVTSLPRSAETGRRAGRAVARSRPAPGSQLGRLF
jgi:hypothetical protein